MFRRDKIQKKITMNGQFKKLSILKENFNVEKNSRNVFGTTTSFEVIQHGCIKSATVRHMRGTFAIRYLRPNLYFMPSETERWGRNVTLNA